MLYSEVAQNDGIYKQLFALPHFELPITNDVVTVDFLDKKFLFQNANKDLQLPNLQVAAQIVAAKYYDKWNTYIKAVLSKNLPNGETTTTETTGTTNNNVSAMDAPTSVPVNGQDLHTSTTTTVNSAQNTSFLLNLYQKYSIYDMIDTDIRRTLFLNVY